MSRLKKTIFTLSAALIFLAVFVFDVVRTTAGQEFGWWQYLREGSVFVAFLLLFLFVHASRTSRPLAVPKNIGRLLAYSFAIVVLMASLMFISRAPADAGGMNQTAQGALQILTSSIVVVSLGLFSISALLTIRELVLYKRKRGTKRNFIAYVAVMLAANGTTLFLLPGDGRIVVTILFSLAVILAVVNSFKQNWVVYLSRREKLFSIAYSALLFLTFLTINLLLGQSAPEQALMRYHLPLQSFIQLNAIFGVIYFGMAFVSALFHLPTAEVYERKQSELTSLHNLSRLVTQVFDFSDLVNTVTSMTLEVVGATSAWLELVKGRREDGAVLVEVVSPKNISLQQIEGIAVDSDLSLRKLIADSKRALSIEDVSADKRTKHIKKLGVPVGSLLSVPLVSHDELIGILHATKDFEYGFDQDDIDVMTTFADHVTIAIENSRLISESLERERFQQEIMVAQRMQKRLLPQRIPSYASLDIAAVSEPSLEVGGDYYDFVALDPQRLGIVVGDVSGKGVSAAFYMAEVKGIFQSLSKICASPRELILRANQALMDSLERNAFVSLLYAVVDLHRSRLSLARAGHCPMIYISGERSDFIRPTGLGLGLTFDDIFDESTQETTISLKRGDVCLFYTDGINEARNPDGEEFGFDRLLQVAVNSRSESAENIINAILQEVRNHTGGFSYGDDVTLVVVKMQ
ncbi:MAG: GAF domain-containing protein [Ignavibacteria bacterium]|nr:GAF domain-containing protein [Ignavibacteria bacterium]